MAGNQTKMIVITAAVNSYNMPGLFNVSNSVAACAVGWVMKLDPQRIAEGILKTQVEGRMNICEHNGYMAVVDFAHNGMSFNNKPLLRCRAS